MRILGISCCLKFQGRPPQRSKERFSRTLFDEVRGLHLVVFVSSAENFSLYRVQWTPAMVSLKLLAAICLACWLGVACATTPTLPQCESAGGGGICSQVLTVFCLVSDCSQCCQHVNACPPSQSYVLPSQCTTKAPPAPTTTLPKVTTPTNPCATVFCAAGPCVNVGGFAVCTTSCPTTPVHCFVHPCSVKTCPSHPGANCLANMCGGCNADFYVHGVKVTSTCNAATTKPPVVTTKPACGPVCHIFCQFGNVKDANGCPTCKCNPPPTTRPTTAAAVTTTVQCGPVCGIFCPFGHVKDSRGCPTCRCNPAPSTTRPKPMTTSAVAVTTRVVCPPLCRIHCPYGHALDSNGCAICKCNPPPTTGTQPTTRMTKPTTRPTTRMTRSTTRPTTRMTKPTTRPTTRMTRSTTRPTRRPTRMTRPTGVTTTRPARAGICPNITSASPVCRVSCTSDASCTSSQMCCSAGCNTVCKTPCAVPQCSQRFHQGSCQYGRAFDSNGCPLCRCSTKCEHARAVAEKSGPRLLGRRRRQAPGGYIVSCEADGSYSPLQCHGSTGYCWCVSTITGANTTLPVGPGRLCTLTCSPTTCATTPPTTSPASSKSPGCGPVCLIHCEYGNVLDASGCSTCACREKPVEVKTIRITLTVDSIPSSRFSMLVSNLDKWQTQIRTQISTRYNVPLTRVTSVSASTSTTGCSTCNLATIKFSLSGTDATPDPSNIAEKIVSEAQSHSLMLYFTTDTGSSLSYSVSSASSSEIQDDSPASSSTVIAIAVSVSVAVVLIGVVVVIIVLRSKSPRGDVLATSFKDDTVLVHTASGNGLADNDYD